MSGPARRRAVLVPVSAEPLDSATLQAKQVFPTTDLGNAERLEWRLSHLARYVHGLGWHLYDGTRWAPDTTRKIEILAADTVRSIYTEAGAVTDSAVRVQLSSHAARSENAGRIAAMLSLASSRPGLALSPADLDKDPFLLNVQNGTVDLKTGELLKHDRERLLTKLAPVRYEPSATCPTWETFVTWTMSGHLESVAFLQRVYGYCITGSVSEQAFFMPYGVGANGKSTQIDTVEHVMGDYAVRAMPDLLLGGGSHPTEMLALAGSRLAIAVEPGSGRRFRDGLVKAMTGEPKFTGRKMHQDPVTLPITFKFVVATNHLPEVRDDSDGFWRRVKLIPFKARVADADRDPSLPAKLRAEAPGILAWLVRGAVAWHRTGLGSAPEVAGATRAYRDEQDLVRRFVEDRCTIDADGWVLVSGLYGAFREWCQASGEEPLSQLQFTTRLRRVENIEPARKKFGRGYSGISFTLSQGQG